MASSCGNKDLAAPRQITPKKCATPHTTSINTLQALIGSIHSVEKNTTELHGFLDGVSRDCTRNRYKNNAENRQFLAHFRVFPRTVSPGYVVACLSLQPVIRGMPENVIANSSVSVPLNIQTETVALFSGGTIPF
jgi:hypothetical protein